MNNNPSIRQLLNFVFLVLLQVLVINHIHISSMVTPFIYILAILLLPFNTPKWLLLTSAFVLGFLIDIFLGTMGMHIAATVLVAFVRPTLLKMISLGRDFDSNESPNMKELGIDWFISYASIMILLHHTALFFLEIFRLDEITSTLMRIIYSALATFILVVMSQFLFSSRKS